MAEFVAKLLPNLAVTVSNEDISSTVTEVKDKEMSDNSSTVKILRPTVHNNQKIYLNKDGGFCTGIDLLEQENSGILTKRAERFGLETEENKPSISSLYKSLGIDITDKNSGKYKRVRFDTIHIRGVNNLHSNEVLHYFKDYGSSHIEWINDISCNVVFFDEATCVRALLNLSKTLPLRCLNLRSIDYQSIKLKKKETASVELTQDMSALDIGDCGIIYDSKESGDMDVDYPSDHESQPIDIPIPPGFWRVGLQHPIAKTLLLRFATTDDKKLKGAEKRSKFYQEHGNPNYGGLKGLISSSKKHKTQVVANRSAVRDSSSSLPSHLADTDVAKKHKQKSFRMRMYADDEELKLKKNRFNNSLSARKPNVHSRLGKKHSYDELCRLGASTSSANDRRAYKGNSNRYYSSDRYQYGNFKSKQSTLDLRSKLRRRNSDNYPRQYTRNQKNDDYIPQHSQVEQLKKESRSIYKRKHRSPLCDDDDDDIEDDLSSD